MRRSSGFVAAFVALQVAIPLLGLWLRWSTQVSGIPFSWQMYTSIP
jgi:hypothetical protein